MIYISTFVFFVFIAVIIFYKKKTYPQAMCSICGKEFYEKELHLIDEFSLCSTDFIIYQQKKWKLYKSFISDPDNPDASMEVYHLKKDYESRGLKSYIKTAYFEKNDVLYSQFDFYTLDE